MYLHRYIHISVDIGLHTCTDIDADLSKRPKWDLKGPVMVLNGPYWGAYFLAQSSLGYGVMALREAPRSVE